MSSPPPAPALPLPWPPEVTAFLKNIGDGYGYFNPHRLGHRQHGTAVQVTRTDGNHPAPTDKEMVLKVLDLSDKSKEWRQRFTKVQIIALQKLRHPSLILCHKAFGEPGDTMWFLEYDLFRCNLSAAVKNHDNKRLPEEKGKKWCKQMIEGIMFLHANHWPHRDLKMENILMTQTDSIVITDFAFTQEQKTGLPNPLTGSLTYAAPEVLQDPLNCNPFKADVWALGVIFYGMHADTRIFHKESERTVIEAEHKLPPSHSKSMPVVNDPVLMHKELSDIQRRIRNGMQAFQRSESLNDLLSRILVIDPSGRLPLDEMLEHVWFTEKAEDQRLMKSSGKSVTGRH